MSNTIKTITASKLFKSHFRIACLRTKFAVEKKLEPKLGWVKFQNEKRIWIKRGNNNTYNLKVNFSRIPLVKYSQYAPINFRKSGLFYQWTSRYFVGGSRKKTEKRKHLQIFERLSVTKRRIAFLKDTSKIEANAFSEIESIFISKFNDEMGKLHAKLNASNKKD